MPMQYVGSLVHEHQGRGGPSMLDVKQQKLSMKSQILRDTLAQNAEVRAAATHDADMTEAQIRSELLSLALAKGEESWKDEKTLSSQAVTLGQQGIEAGSAQQEEWEKGRSKREAMADIELADAGYDLMFKAVAGGGNIKIGSPDASRMFKQLPLGLRSVAETIHRNMWSKVYIGQEVEDALWESVGGDPGQIKALHRYFNERALGANVEATLEGFIARFGEDGGSRYFELEKSFLVIEARATLEAGNALERMAMVADIQTTGGKHVGDFMSLLSGDLEAEEVLGKAKLSDDQERLREALRAFAGRRERPEVEDTLAYTAPGAEDTGLTHDEEVTLLELNPKAAPALKEEMNELIAARGKVLKAVIVPGKTITSYSFNAWRDICDVLASHKGEGIARLDEIVAKIDESLKEGDEGFIKFISKALNRHAIYQAGNSYLREKQRVMESFQGKRTQEAALAAREGRRQARQK